MYDNIMRKSQLDTRELLLLESEVKNHGKNMLVAYVLWYFLGMFGAHRFYMGRIGSAVFQLILTITVIGAFFTFIWWIIDAFMLHNWVRDRNREIEDRIVNQMLAGRMNSSYSAAPTF